MLGLYGLADAQPLSTQKKPTPATASLAPAATGMSNQDIIKMTASGLADEIILMPSGKPKNDCLP